MTTHTQSQGDKWHSSVDSTVMYRASKCKSPRFRVNSNATVLATALLVTSSIAVSTSYLRLDQDSLKRKLSTETTSNINIDVPSHVRGISASLSPSPNQLFLELLHRKLRRLASYDRLRGVGCKSLDEPWCN